MREFQQANSTFKWPTSVSISCFWDAHPFSNQPVSVPIKKEGDTYYLYGNFCSLECAAAWVFDRYRHDHVARNEIYSLLHLLYKQTKPIKLADERETLKIWGGQRNILEFRQLSNTRYISNKIIMPPFLSLIPIQEEVCINTNIRSTLSSYIPVNKLQLSKATENVRAQNKTEIKKNCLENCMNLTYN